MRSSSKRSIARAMRRFPLLHWLLVHALNLTSARVSVGASGVVYNQEGEVLLLEHVFRSRYPWGVPGGWVRRREHPGDALRRELMEEAGLEVSVGPPVLVQPYGPPGHLEIAFLCEARGEVAQLSDEILSASWVDPRNLPTGLRQLDELMITQAETIRRGANAAGNLEVGSDGQP